MRPLPPTFATHPFSIPPRADVNHQYWSMGAPFVLSQLRGPLLRANPSRSANRGEERDVGGQKSGVGKSIPH